MAVTLNVKKRPSIDLLFQLIFGYLGEKNHQSQSKLYNICFISHYHTTNFLISAKFSLKFRNQSEIKYFQ